MINTIDGFAHVQQNHSKELLLAHAIFICYMFIPESYQNLYFIKRKHFLGV